MCWETEFFLKSLKDNNADLMMSFTAHLGVLADRVGEIAGRIKENTVAIKKQSDRVTSNKSEIDKLTARVEVLPVLRETGQSLPPRHPSPGNTLRRGDLRGRGPSQVQTRKHFGEPSANSYTKHWKSRSVTWDRKISKKLDASKQTYPKEYRTRLSSCLRTGENRT